MDLNDNESAETLKNEKIPLAEDMPPHQTNDNRSITEVVNAAGASSTNNARQGGGLGEYNAPEEGELSEQNEEMQTEEQKNNTSHTHSEDNGNLYD